MTPTEGTGPNGSTTDGIASSGARNSERKVIETANGAGKRRSGGTMVVTDGGAAPAKTGDDPDEAISHPPGRYRFVFWGDGDLAVAFDYVG